MTRKQGLPVLLSLGLLLASLAASSHAAPAAAGVTVLQFSCSYGPSGSVIGPATVNVTGSGSCSANGSYSAPPVPLPAGRLFHLQILPQVGTYNGAPPNVQFTVYNGNTIATPLTCTFYTPPVFKCVDNTHEYALKAGDQIQILANIPDSNTVLSSVSATLEESLSQ
jgi:hypothetical protein